MLNQIVLVGRLVRNPEVKKSKNKDDFSYITLAVPRSYKNATGEYETDFIDCLLWKHMAVNTAEYCKKGDIIAIKGRIESRIEEKDNEKKYLTEVIAEKVTFLSNNKAKEV